VGRKLAFAPNWEETAMGREFEIKYAATEQAFRALREVFGPFTRIAMETTYFDTPDHGLSRQKMTLRLRKENDETICTLKTPLPDGELETHCRKMGVLVQTLSRFYHDRVPEEHRCTLVVNYGGLSDLELDRLEQVLSKSVAI
jgi:uncharacterized protein YjbK